MTDFKPFEDRRFSLANRRKHSSPIEEKLRMMRKRLCRLINKLFAFVFVEEAIDIEAADKLKLRMLTTSSLIKEWTSMFDFAIQLLDAQETRRRDIEAAGLEQVAGV